MFGDLADALDASAIDAALVIPGIVALIVVLASIGWGKKVGSKAS